MVLNAHNITISKDFISESVYSPPTEFCRPANRNCCLQRKKQITSLRFLGSSQSRKLGLMATNRATMAEKSKKCSSAVLEPSIYDIGNSTNIKWHESTVGKEERQKLMNQKGCIVWFTGLSGSGKSTLAYTLDHALTSLGKITFVLDGDNIRHGLNRNLGFSQEDRVENIRRIAEVAKLFTQANVITLVSFISPYRQDRQAARDLVPPGDFIEVYMKIPLCVCESRDPKGLYKLAREGKIKGFTGVDDPYEAPENPEVVMEVAREDADMLSPDAMADRVLQYLEEKSFLSA